MPHHNDLRVQQRRLLDVDISRIARAEVLFHREIPIGKLRGFGSQDRSCEGCLRVCVRLGQAIRRDTRQMCRAGKVPWCLWTDPTTSGRSYFCGVH